MAHVSAAHEPTLVRWAASSRLVQAQGSGGRSLWLAQQYRSHCQWQLLHPIDQTVSGGRPHFGSDHRSKSWGGRRFVLRTGPLFIVPAISPPTRTPAHPSHMLGLLDMVGDNQGRHM